MNALLPISLSQRSSPSHSMRTGPRLFRRCVVAALMLSLAGTARAATASFTNNTPTLGADDISQLIGATNQASNVAGGGDDGLYLASNRPIQGQTFRTGSNANGYALTAVTLKQVAYNTTYALVPTITYTIRISSPSGSILTVLAEETASVAEDATDCGTCNFPSISGGCCEGTGSGRYITFTFDTPVVLNPDTTYGFDAGGVSSFHYWETDGTSNTNAHTGGTAYSSGSGGLGDTGLIERTGDRVFVVGLTAALIPLPPRIHIQPKPVTLYAGRTAQFSATASGSPTLVYQWQKNGAPILKGGNVSGATTDALTLDNITADDAGSYTLVVTNSALLANSVTSAPAVLTVVAAPAPGSYGYSVLTNNPIAYWRLDESSDPSTNPPAYEYAGGFAGTYEIGSLNGFGGIAGPRPVAFPGFASTNNAVQSSVSTTPTWVTVPPLNLNTNTVTMTAWIYSNGDQDPNGYSGLFIIGGGNAGFAYGGDYSGNGGELIYWWAGGSTWRFRSGLVIPTNQWLFVAVVIEPTRATLYLGSGGALNSAVNVTPHLNESLSANGEIGHQPGHGADSRVFNGSIDEVAVFKRSLSFDEINALHGSGLGSIQARPPTLVKQPLSTALYAGRTARFEAIAAGSSPLIYQWKKNGTDVTDGGNVSGAQTDALTINNISAGDAADYTLVVTNSANPAATSAPPATLTVVAPSGKAYEAAVRSANPVAYWRLNETANPATGNMPAFDYWGGLVGTYGNNATNGFNGVAGPRPSDFPEFEASNTALQSTDNLEQSWVTVPSLNLNTNTVTLTLWLHPNVDPISGYTGVFYTRRGGSPGGAGIQYTIDNQIGYTWNGGNQNTWGFYSGLVVPANQWSFVAVVIEPTQATLYLYNSNGLLSTNNPIPHISEPWDGTADIGGDPDNDVGRTFEGMIDEVAVFNYAFTPAQILNLYNSAFQSPVTLSIQKVGADVQLTWPRGTLLEANEVTGPWTTNSATSPYITGPAGAKKFFRVRVQ